MKRAFIELSSIAYTYPKGGFTLEAPGLDFPLGQVTLLCGGNGSGKTTLTRLMCGVLRPDRGQVLIDGQGIAGWPLGRVGRQVGYLLQEPARQLFCTQVWQELLFASRLRGEDEDEAAQRAETLLTEFGLSRLRQRAPFRLSRGEQQRLALAALLMGPARFFILDEPTTGLDQENRRLLYAKLDQLLEQGLGFAIASHDPGLLARWPQRRVRLEQGRAELC